MSIKKNITMNLPFSRHFKSGTPTYFVEKILAGLIKEKMLSISKASEIIRLSGAECTHPMFYIDGVKPYLKTIKPKIHTFRPSPNWEKAKDSRMYFWTGVPYRSKQFQFVPMRLPIKTQKAEITPGGLVVIDGRPLSSAEQDKIMENDGFDSHKVFYEWFNMPFAGYLIHWTDFKY